MDKVLIHYAREIANVAPGEVPGWSWGSTVLAATYRGLCQACFKTEQNVVITSCPFLLQLWSYERLAIARPVINEHPYPQGMNDMWEEDKPTMGSLWTDRRVRLLNLHGKYTIYFCIFLLFYHNIHEK